MQICDWCGKKASVLVEHHYPVYKKDEGTETVEICPKCHSAAHGTHFISAFDAKDPSEYERIVRAKTEALVSELFPLLDGLMKGWSAFVVPVQRILVINPLWMTNLSPEDQEEVRAALESAKKLLFPEKA